MLVGGWGDREWRPTNGFSIFYLLNSQSKLTCSWNTQSKKLFPRVPWLSWLWTNSLGVWEKEGATVVDANGWRTGWIGCLSRKLISNILSNRLKSACDYYDSFIWTNIAMARSTVKRPTWMKIIIGFVEWERSKWRKKRWTVFIKCARVPGIVLSWMQLFPGTRSSAHVCYENFSYAFI